ncbi:hypothetical protein JCM1840_006768, partial [Sporobolomyces johnsonii]
MSAFAAADDPPEVPLDFQSTNSDLAAAWQAVRPAVSEVGSGQSRASKASMRAQAREAVEQARLRRLAEFEAREAEIEGAVKEELDRWDAETASSRSARPPSVVGIEADLEVLKRQRDEARTKFALLERIIQSKMYSREQSPLPSPVPPNVAVPVAASLSPSSPVRAENPGGYLVSPPPAPLPVAEEAPLPPPSFLDIDLKKISAPKPWVGDFSYRRREAWIKTAVGYWASVGVKVSTPIDEYLTPKAHFAVRSLFSSEARGQGIPAVDWFDSITTLARTFYTPQDVLDEMRAHWVDDAAAEDNFRRYRQARQGALKVREFGALVQQLAQDCFDRTISDEDKASTFREGLNPPVRDFLLQV